MFIICGCLVAEDNDSSIIGVIMVGNDGRRGYIYHTAVHPNCRKQGAILSRPLFSDSVSLFGLLDKIIVVLNTITIYIFFAFEYSL